MFKIATLRVNTPLPTAPPSVEARLELVDVDLLQDARHSCLNVLDCPEVVSFQARLEPGKQEKVSWCKVRAVGRLRNSWDNLLRKELLHQHGRVTGRIVVMENPVISNLRTDTRNPLLQSFEYFHVKCSIDRLSGLKELFMDDAF